MGKNGSIKIGQLCNRDDKFHKQQQSDIFGCFMFSLAKEERIFPCERLYPK